MREKYPICCGVDIHKATAVACLRQSEAGGLVRHETREFATTTQSLRDLAFWLQAAACPVVAMESTGDYWKPVRHVLVEHGIEVVIFNARDAKPRKGRKTDKADAAWLSELLAFDQLLPSYIPPEPVSALRDLTRMRMAFVNQRSQVRNRIHKVLEDAGIKLSCVAANILGVSGRAMLDALLAGQREPKVLAGLARGRLKRKVVGLVAALEGRFNEHHAFLLQVLLTQFDAHDRTVAELDGRILVVERAYEDAIRRLCTIPGVSRIAARMIVGEIGIDMNQFGSAGRLASWAGLCPGNNVTAGKRLSGRTRKGNRYLRAVLTQCAWAARRTQSFHGRTFGRLSARIGGKKAAIAIAHKILVVAYHILANGVDFDEGRYAAFAAKEDTRRLNRALRNIRDLGCNVEIRAVEALPPDPPAAAHRNADPISATDIRDHHVRVEVPVAGSPLPEQRPTATRRTRGKSTSPRSS
jgi:transposase